MPIFADIYILHTYACGDQQNALLQNGRRSARPPIDTWAAELPIIAICAAVAAVAAVIVIYALAFSRLYVACGAAHSGHAPWDGRNASNLQCCANDYVTVGNT